MYTDELANASRKGFQTLWDDSIARPDDRKVLEAIHGIQRGLHCCGRTSSSDWLVRGGVPTSCCEDGVNSCNVGNAFPQGCETVREIFYL
jgi:Tetraspanin family